MEGAPLTQDLLIRTGAEKLGGKITLISHSHSSRTSAHGGSCTAAAPEGQQREGMATAPQEPGLGGGLPQPLGTTVVARVGC